MNKFSRFPIMPKFRRKRIFVKRLLIVITCYDKDCYDTLTGLVSNIEPVYRTITIVKTKIAIDDVYDIRIESDRIKL